MASPSLHTPYHSIWRCFIHVYTVYSRCNEGLHSPWHLHRVGADVTPVHYVSSWQSPSRRTRRGWPHHRCTHPSTVSGAVVYMITSPYHVTTQVCTCRGTTVASTQWAIDMLYTMKTSSREARLASRHTHLLSIWTCCRHAYVAIEGYAADRQMLVACRASCLQSL